MKTGKYAISILNQVLWNKKKKKNTKENKHKIYKSIVRNTALYGAKTWQLKNTFKKKMLFSARDGLLEKSSENFKNR